jgi:hypothetical protein
MIGCQQMNKGMKIAVGMVLVVVAAWLFWKHAIPYWSKTPIAPARSSTAKPEPLPLFPPNVIPPEPQKK